MMFAPVDGKGRSSFDSAGTVIATVEVVPALEERTICPVTETGLSLERATDDRSPLAPRGRGPGQNHEEERADCGATTGMPSSATTAPAGAAGLRPCRLVAATPAAASTATTRPNAIQRLGSRAEGPDPIASDDSRRRSPRDIGPPLSLSSDQGSSSIGTLVDGLLVEPVAGSPAVVAVVDRCSPVSTRLA